MLEAHCHPIPLGWPKGPAVRHWPGTCSPCGPSFIPGSLTLRLRGSHANERPPPGGHPDVQESCLGAARWGLLTWDPGPDTAVSAAQSRPGILPRTPPGSHPRAPCPLCSPSGGGLGPAPCPPCDEWAGEAGRTRRKLPGPNIISQMQAPWLLGASGDVVLMAVLGLLRACGCPA